MKKAWILSILALTVTVCAYAAPDRTGRWDAGVSTNAAIPSDGEVDAAFQIGGNVAYGVNEWFAVGFSGGWQEHSVDPITVGTVSISGYDVSAIPLFGDLIVRVPTGDQPFNPYGVLGLGAVIWDVDDATANSGGTALTAETDVETEFAVKAGGGVDWFINERWILNVEGAYVFSNPESRVTVAGASISEDVDLDYWTVGGGLKYLF